MTGIYSNQSHPFRFNHGGEKTFSVHALVMLTLQVAYRGVVAPDSIVAMTVRLIVWAIILTLMWVQARKGKIPA